MTLGRHSDRFVGADKPVKPVRYSLEDHKVEGEVLFSDEEHLWVAVIDWKVIRTSEQRAPVS
jgi:hypothetical protein